MHSLEDHPLLHPTPSGVVEAIHIFRPWAENKDEAILKAILRQAKVDILNGVPDYHSDRVMPLVEAALHIPLQQI